MAVLTAEMIVDRPVPSEAQISPDGRLVAYVVAPAGQREEQALSALWLVASDGSTPARQLTAGLAHDRTPRWSPDGAWLYFLSDRARRGTAQLHRLPLTGGEAQSLTDGQAGVETYVPLPDGRTIALTMADPRTADEERRERERDDARVFGEPWRHARPRLLALSTRELRTLTGLPERHVTALAPSPDGRWLAAISWPTPEMDNLMAETTIHLIDPIADTATLLATLPGGAWSPTWAPDSTHLLVLSGAEPGGVGGVVALLLPLEGGRPQPAADDTTACPRSLCAPRQGRPLLVQAEGLDSAIYALERTGVGAARLSHHRGDLTAISLSADGDLLAAIRSEPDAPDEVWAGPPTGPLRCLTTLSPDLRAVTWGTQERLAWTASDGQALDGLLIVPPGQTRAAGPFPLITLVHGGPYGRTPDSFHLGWGQWGQWLATHGYAVFLPNPRGGLGHGPAFAASVAGAVGREDYTDIMAGIDHLIAAGVADPARLGIGGWSQGGFMSAWAVGQTDLFAAAVMGAGVSDWGMMVAESDWPAFESRLGGSTGWEGIGPHPHDELSPISYARRVRTPVLILHGERDERVPVGQGRFFARALRAHGIPHQLVVYPREPHGIRERLHQLDILHRVRAWYDRWLRPEHVQKH